MLNELRRGYLGCEWVIVARERGSRPDDFAKDKRTRREKKDCFFCPGSEGKTPPEISRIEEGGKWVVRCFPNKFSATSFEDVDLSKDDLVGRSAYGRHEVIVETPDHEKYLHELSVEHLAKVVDMYAQRITENMKDPKVRYVLVFKNEGLEAGTSLEHSHSQVVSLSMVPSRIQNEIDAAKEYQKEKGSCPFCDIQRKESKSERMIYEDDFFTVFAPYASRFPFQAVVMPKRHVSSLEGLNPVERLSLASIIKKVETVLNTTLNFPPHNYYFHVSPKDEDIHFHMEICPRLARWAGFELGSGIIINTMPPESAAEHYRKNIPLI
jgi:UDPglucose--hexose-1-phosphate uridylyltransferase